MDSIQNLFTSSAASDGAALNAGTYQMPTQNLMATTPTMTGGSLFGGTNWGQIFRGAVPSTFGATGQLTSGLVGASAMRSNAASFRAEGNLAAAQGAEEEAQTRRASAVQLGSIRAAVAQAGAGTTGSAGRAVAQDAANAELNALSVRYKAQVQQWAYSTQASNLESEATATQDRGILAAGAQLLKGYSNSYLDQGLG